MDSIQKFDAEPVVSVNQLSIGFHTRQGDITAVRDVTWQVHRGEILGIVGESGSGKSVSTLALIGLLDDNGYIVSGSMTYQQHLLTARSKSAQEKQYRASMAMIFQYPRMALNPIRRVGKQLMDVLQVIGTPGNRAVLKARAIELLNEVQIHEPEQRFHAYPFELSGGMCQRVLIAMALARSPDLLIADEPTTGLDVVTQDAILGMITQAATTRQMATLLITHDLGLAAKYCHRIVVMEQGQVVEQAPAKALFTNPKHPYTRALIAATPALMRDLDDLRAVYRTPEEAA